jgi:hypothetical protein
MDVGFGHSSNFTFSSVWQAAANQATVNHPWISTTGDDAITVRGFIYDVDSGKLNEVSYPGPTGSIGRSGKPSSSEEGNRGTFFTRRGIHGAAPHACPYLGGCF